MHPILADRRRLQLHLVAWGLVGALLGLLVRTIIGTPWLDTLLLALPLGLIAAPISLSAWYLVRATPASRTAAWRIAITAVGAATVTSALWADYASGLVYWRLSSQLRWHFLASYFRNGRPPADGFIPGGPGAAASGYALGTGLEW